MSRRAALAARGARSARERLAVALAAIGTAALLLGASGCAPEPAPARPSSSAPKPTKTTPPPPTLEELRHAEAQRLVASWTPRERAGSIVMAGFEGTDPAPVRAFAAQQHLGGVILMGGNVPGTPEELRTLTAGLSPDPKLPVLTGIDEEGGEVTRLPWDDLPGAAELRSQPPAQTTTAFRSRAGLLHDGGVTVNFGIVADVTSDPNSFIFGRVLGETAAESGPRVAAAVAGERGLVASTLKHFPGHGAAPGDSHSGIPRTDLDRASWKRDEAPPFADGIAAGAQLLMFGHLAYTAVDAAPASLSPTWHRIARDELGFTGVAVTDDLGMLLFSGDQAYADPTKNAVDALAAGNDLLLMVIGSDQATATGAIDGIAAAVAAKTVPEARLTDAATRVTELRLELAGWKPPAS